MNYSPEALHARNSIGHQLETKSGPSDAAAEWTEVVDVPATLLRRQATHHDRGRPAAWQHCENSPIVRRDVASTRRSGAVRPGAERRQWFALPSGIQRGGIGHVNKAAPILEPYLRRELAPRQLRTRWLCVGLQPSTMMRCSADIRDQNARSAIRWGGFFCGLFRLP